MARAPDTRVEQAHDLYKQGNKLVEIANQLNIPVGTIRSWKKRYEWECNATHEKKCNVAKVKKNKEVKKEVFDDGTKETMMNENLTHEQRLFCIYYSKDHNAVQSYIKAYNCSYQNACGNAHKLLKNIEISKEVDRLIELKAKSVRFSSEELVELHMRIAYADIGNYLTFGKERIPQWKKDENDEYIPIIDPNTGEQKINEYNTVDLKESTNTDTQLIQEVKEGKDGVSIKLADKQKSLDWLEKFFLMNPMDKHKIAYDNAKLESEREEQQIRIKKLEAELAKATGTSNENELSKLDEMLAEIKKQAGGTNDT